MSSFGLGLALLEESSFAGALIWLTCGRLVVASCWVSLPVFRLVACGYLPSSVSLYISHLVRLWLDVWFFSRLFTGRVKTRGSSRVESARPVIFWRPPDPARGSGHDPWRVLLNMSGPVLPSAAYSSEELIHIAVLTNNKIVKISRKTPTKDKRDRFTATIYFL